jgi:hypothetical protein
MKTLKYLIMLLCIQQTALAKNIIITGDVKVMTPYCGGARPDKATVKNATTWMPYASKKFYIKKGNINSIDKAITDSFMTDNVGNFKIQLPKGNYCILLEEQIVALDMTKYNTKFQKADEACLQKWWATPYYLLQVKTKNKPLHFEFTKRCYIQSEAPCLQYNGPKHP